MKSISIYAVTRNQNIGQLQKLERQLSGREYFLKMRTWELESMRSLVRELEAHMDEVYALRFFYSFQIPRLGKEFDLLQIKDEQIVNIELKSGAVSDETIRKQLISEPLLSVCAGAPDLFLHLHQQSEPACKTDEPRSYCGGRLAAVVRTLEK